MKNARLKAVILASMVVAFTAAQYLSNNGVDLVLELENEGRAADFKACHAECAEGTRAYLKELVNDTFYDFSFVYATDSRGYPKTDVNRYGGCMLKCLKIEPEQEGFGIEYDPDFLFVSGNSDEIKDILDTIGSDLPLDYEYFGSGEDGDTDPYIFSDDDDDDRDELK